MPDESAQDRTESATPRKRGEARKQGRVAKSTELTGSIVLLGIMMGLRSFGANASRVVQIYFQQIVRQIATPQLSTTIVIHLLIDAMLTLGRAVAPLLLTAMTLGVLSNIVQTGPVWAPEAMKLNFAKLNPLTGLQRFVSAQGAVTLFKSIYKIVLVGYICFVTLRSGYPQILELSRLDISQAVGVVSDIVFRLVSRVVTTMMILAALDFAFQKFSFEKSIRMSKYDVKKEHKDEEVSPQLKQRIRSRQREMAKKRMMADVPTADVIITNPTHFAVALKYESGRNTAPIVIAKGMDTIALRIREIALNNDVPIVENPPLARALYKQVDIGREIPGELYEAVAEVLAFVYRINQRRRERAGLALGR